jgi:hypothetical protein
VTFHLKDNAVVPDTKPEQPFLSAEGFHSPRPRVVGQGSIRGLRAALHLRGESPQIALRSWSEDDGVDRSLQLEPQIRRPVSVLFRLMQSPLG